MLNEVKHLANVSCQVPARDSSDATLCRMTLNTGRKHLWTTAILSPLFILGSKENLNLFRGPAWILLKSFTQKEYGPF